MVTMDKEKTVLKILTRYGLFDRKVIVSKKGVTVFLPEGCRNGDDDSLFEDIAEALHDTLGLAILNVRNGMTAEEFVRKNRVRLEQLGII